MAVVGRGKAEGDGAAADRAGDDCIVPVLPAAAGRAPLPRHLRYRPRVLTGRGPVRPAAWGPAGRLRSAALSTRVSDSARVCEAVLDPHHGTVRVPRGPVCDSRGRAPFCRWPGDVGPQLTWTGAWAADAPRPAVGCSERLWGRPSHCPGRREAGTVAEASCRFLREKVAAWGAAGLKCGVRLSPRRFAAAYQLLPSLWLCI